MSLSVIAIISEERLREAELRGEFSDLPGTVQPLKLEDETWIPEDLRMAYKILRNGGLLPPELAVRKEVSSLLDLLENTSNEAEKVRQMQTLPGVLQKMRQKRCQRALTLADKDPYYAKEL